MAKLNKEKSRLKKKMQQKWGKKSKEKNHKPL